MISSKSSSVRRRLTPQQRQLLLALFHKDQLTQREFANRHGIGLSTLSKWLRCEDKTVMPPVKFQEVTLPHMPLRYAVELVSPQGWTVRLQNTSDIESLPQLLQALPPQPIEQGMVGPGLLAQILVNKYEYHLPLYRQEKMFRQQFGVDLSRKTMGCWVEQAAELLKPVYRTIREDLVSGSYLQADETPIRYLDPDVKGKSQQGYLWTYSRPGGDVLFEWRVSRSREGPKEFLKDFRGKLQTDGYAAYESLAKERNELTLIGCWAQPTARI